MISGLKKHLKNTKGFTLVEMIVVMVILGILLTGGTFGYLRYVKNAEFKKNNDYAKSIFTAAQSQLSYYKSGGLLEEFVEKTKDIPAPTVSTEVATYAKDTKASLVYLQTTNGAENIEDTLLYEMTKDYIHDKSIYNAAIRIEFDPASARVFSVCYNGKKTTFAEDEVTLAKRKTEERKKTGLGYYETDVVLRTVKNKQNQGGDPPEVKSAMLINEEVLKIEMTFENDQIQNIRNGKYLVELRYLTNTWSTEDQYKEVVSSFVINDGSATNTLPEGNTNKRLTTDVKRVVENDNSACYFQTYIKDNKLGIVLDAMDLEAARIHYNKLLNNQNAYKSADYSLTSSAMRLGVMGLTTRFEIEAKITVLSADDDISGVYVTERENPLMDSRNLYNPYNYMVYPRHVYNIRFDQSRTGNQDYMINRDITWGAIEPGLDTIAVFDNAQNDNSCLLTKEDAYFPAIPELISGSTLKQGTNKSLAKFLIRPFNTKGSGDGEYPGKLGLFMTNKGSIQSISLNEFLIEDMEIALDGVGTVAGSNQGSIVDTEVVKSTIKCEASSNVGGFLGTIPTGSTSSDIRNLSVSESSVLAKNNVGGFIGTSSMALSALSVKNTTIEGIGDNSGGILGTNTSSFGYGVSIEGLTVKGTNNVGGVTGTNNGNLNVGPLTISGKIIVDGQGDNIGGLVGTNNQSLNPDGAKLLENFVITGKNNVGGIAGYNKSTIKNIGIKGESVTINNSENSVGGLVGCNDTDGVVTIDGSAITIENLTLEGQNNVGGLIGYNRGKLEEYGIKNSTIIGADNVGGVVGYNLSNSVIQKSGNTQALENVIVTGDYYVGGVAGTSNGTISQYAIKNSTVSGTDTIGGLVGNHGSSGIIKGEYSNSQLSSNSNIAVSGTYYVGGLIGSNSGQIYGFRIDDSSITGNQYVGGIVGDNLKNAIVKGDKLNGSDIKLNNLTVNGTNYVGGFIGNNDGSVSGLGLGNSSIIGENTVGGIVGHNKSNLLQDSDTWFSNLTVIGGYNVGGLVGLNNATLQNFYLSGSKVDRNATNVSAETNAIGGVIGSNTGTLECTTGTKMIEMTITTTGANGVGGVVGYNEGTINGYGASNSRISWEDARGNEDLGSVVGINKGTITSSTVITMYLNAVWGQKNIGGVAGYNSGTIRNFQVKGKSSEHSNIRGYENVGGHVGYSYNGTLDAQAKVENIYLNIGGDRKTSPYNANDTNATNIGGFVGYQAGTLSVGGQSNWVIKDVGFLDTRNVHLYGKDGSRGNYIGNLQKDSW